MASLFLSYKLEDRELARSIKQKLERLGHTIRIDIDEVFAGSEWRDKLMRALMESDAVIPLITEKAMKSPFVISEIGAARAFAQTDKQMSLLPILFDNLPIPPFIQDLWILRANSNDENSIALVSNDIDKAINSHLNKLKDGSSNPKLFISHRHKDKTIVSALIDLIKSAFYIEKEDIRCTSVRPYRLPVGERTSDRLKKEIHNAEAVIGIITPDTKESSYVLFELGGAWAQNILTCPLLTKGGSFNDLPDPIRDINPLSLENSGDCHQFIDDLEDSTSLKRRDGVNSEISDRIERLLIESKL